MPRKPDLPSEHDGYGLSLYITWDMYRNLSSHTDYLPFMKQVHTPYIPKHIMVGRDSIYLKLSCAKNRLPSPAVPCAVRYRECLQYELKINKNSHKSY